MVLQEMLVDHQREHERNMNVSNNLRTIHAVVAETFYSKSCVLEEKSGNHQLDCEFQCQFSQQSIQH